MQPMTVATGSREHDASKHGITVMARRVVITVVFLLVLGHTVGAQESPKEVFVDYKGVNFSVKMLDRVPVKITLKHDISHDGAMYTVRNFSQQLGANCLNVYQFDYETVRGEGRADEDKVLTGTYAKFKLLDYLIFRDEKLGWLNARQATTKIEIAGEPYLSVTRIAVQGSRVWLLAVTVRDSDVMPAADLFTFFNSFVPDRMDDGSPDPIFQDDAYKCPAAWSPYVVEAERKAGGDPVHCVKVLQ
jgi:hypothetical protein